MSLTSRRCSTHDPPESCILLPLRARLPICPSARPPFCPSLPLLELQLKVIGPNFNVLLSAPTIHVHLAILELTLAWRSGRYATLISLQGFVRGLFRLLSNVDCAASLPRPIFGSPIIIHHR